MYVYGYVKIPLQKMSGKLNRTSNIKVERKIKLQFTGNLKAVRIYYFRNESR